MSLFAYVLTGIRVFFDAFTRFAYARFLRIFWFAYLRAALYEFTNSPTNVRAITLTLTLLHIDLMWALKDSELSMVRPTCSNFIQ